MLKTVANNKRSSFDKDIKNYLDSISKLLGANATDTFYTMASSDIHIEVLDRTLGSVITNLLYGLRKLMIE